MSLLAALATGLLLFGSDHPLRWWPLQFVAFVPFWLALAARRRAGQPLWPLGACLAIGYAAPLLLVIGIALPIVVAAVASVLQWLLVAMVAGRLLVRGPVRGALAAAGAVTLLELLTWNAVPMFGTAQCFARPLSTAPGVVAFVAWTGVAGVVFASTAVQALLANALTAKHRTAPLLVAGCLALAVAAIDVMRWQRPLGAPLRVAAFGWGADDPPTPSGTLAMLDGVFADAKAKGALLVVTPETGFVTGDDRDKALRHFGELARRHGITAAFGVWHSPTRDNRIWFFGSDGALAAEYRKTHLTPWLESYAAGDGTLAHAAVGDRALGGMICQDDNFTDLARGYGRSATPLLAVPTNDWLEVRFAHLDNSRFRAIENGYAVVRATSNGISALVSPRGELLASCDHTFVGPQLLTGELPLGDGVATPYARFGDWPMLALGALLIALALRRD